MDDGELRSRAAASGIPDLDGFLREQRERIFYLCLKKLKDHQLADEVAQGVMIKFLQSLRGAKPLSKSEYERWLTTVAKNACQDVFRQRAQRSKVKEVPAAEVSASEFRTLSSGGHRRKSFLQAENLDPLEELPQPGLLPTNEDLETHRLFRLTLRERAVFILRETAVPFRVEILQPLLETQLARQVHDARIAWLEQHPVRDRDDYPKRMPYSQIARVLNLPQGTVSSDLSRAKKKLAGLFDPPKTANRPKRVKGPATRERRETPSHGLVRSVNLSEAQKTRVLAAQGIQIPPPAEAPFSLKAWREGMRKMGYKVGSPGKGCMNCGNFKWRWKKLPEKPSGAGSLPTTETEPTTKTKSFVRIKFYTSGFDVYRAYKPSEAGFTFGCYQCGAKDENCWENCQDELGKEPRLLPNEEKERRRDLGLPTNT